jgi:hypothetical protein
MTGESTPAADISLAVLLDSGTLLLFGAVDRPLPAAGTALLDRDTGRPAVYRGLILPSAGAHSGAGQPAGGWFVALLRRDRIAEPQPRQVSIPADDGEITFDIPKVQTSRIDPAVLLTIMRADLNERMPDAFDFLRQTLAAPDLGPLSKRAADLLAGLLSAMSQSDGFVEILGTVRQTGIMLQGWSFHLQSDRYDMILETGGFSVHAAAVGTFERSDLSARARGMIAILPGADTIDPASLRRVYFRADSGYFHLEMYERRTQLAPAEVVPHLKASLPNLLMKMPIAQAFRRFAMPRFGGQETVTALTLPVRAAVDQAVLVPGAGILLAGWLLDPGGAVTEVSIRNTEGFYVRLDETWSRMPRPDVTEGYSTDPVFQHRLDPNDHGHGFAAFAPCQDAGRGAGTWYLELALSDQECAFIPLRLPEKVSRATVRQLLANFNLDDPLAERLVGTQIAPALWGAVQHLSGSGRSMAIYAFGRSAEKPRVSAILPVLDGREDLDTTLAQFGVDPDFAAVELIVVSPPQAGERVGPLLRRYGRFYGLHGRFILAGDALDHFEALEIGAQHATAGMLLFMAPSVVPRRPGWLSELSRRLAGAGDAGIISPTLLYEDDSIKFAGIRIEGPARSGSELKLKSQFAGYSRHWLKTLEVTRVQAVTAECCLLPRRLFAEVGGFSKEYVSPDYKGLDLSLKIEAAGRACLWAPMVELFAVDDQQTAGAAEYWHRTGLVIDRIGFDRKWSPFLSNQGDTP